MLEKIKKFWREHRTASIIILIIIILIAYFSYQKLKSNATPTSYILGTVVKDTLVTTVSGTGQVTNSNQVDLKSKVSSQVTALNIESGQSVLAQTVLIQFDAENARKAVRDASANLDSAKLALTKIQQPADQLSLIQSENSLAQAQESKQSALADLTKSYEDAFNTTADAFLNLPNITTGLYSILYGTNAANGDQWIDYYTNIIKNKDESILTYKNDANNDYTAARTNYDEAFANYKSTDRSATNDTIESLLQKTYDTAKTVAQAVKSTNNLIQFYKDRATAYGIRTNSTADSQLTTLSNYTNSINSVLSNLLNIKTTIQNDKDTIINAERTIAEKTESLAKLKTGADPLDIQSQQMTIRQRENALLDAQEQFADYFIKAPFDGIIAKVDVKKGDTISANTTVATLVTKQQVAEISLNEVDAAKIKVGEKATLTFDAIDDLSIAGEVIDLDTIGTVSQGVVTYNVKIGFDSQDDRVKSGMSVSANIITNVKSDVLIVPNSAIKQQGNNYYVEIFDQKPAAPASSSGAVTSDTPPRRQTVTIGLANDTETEIVSGLTEGQEIVTRTITSTATSQTTSQAPSLFGGGNTRGALTGNAIRIGR